MLMSHYHPMTIRTQKLAPTRLDGSEHQPHHAHRASYHWRQLVSLWGTHAYFTMCIIGSAIFEFGIMSTFIPIQLYLVDTFTYYVATATASTFRIRIPSLWTKMLDTLGYGEATSSLQVCSYRRSPFGYIALENVYVHRA
ncbi:hypothetical protein P692DRAFT_20904785, partial [Suillus brevipes Sb2]